MLREIGADVVPSLLRLNKVDRLEPATREALRERHPDAIQLSAKSTADVAALRLRLIEHFEHSMDNAEIFVPYAKQGLLGESFENARVLSEEYEETGRRMQVRGLPGAIARLQRALAA